MGDLVGVFLVVVLALIAVFTVVSVLQSNRKQLGHSAPIPGSSVKEANAQARVAYHLAQQAVLILDRLINDDMTRVVIPEVTQQKIRALSKEFYEL